jgi:hypothetical protein
MQEKTNEEPIPEWMNREQAELMLSEMTDAVQSSLECSE